MSSLRHATAVCLAALLLSCSKQPPNSVMNNSHASPGDGLFLSWQNTNSLRHAILEELDGMVWLYLTTPDSRKAERDCPAFTRRTPVEHVDWKLIEKTGAPPPISKDVASQTCQIQQPRAEDFSVSWSNDGESVGLVYHTKIIAMIVAGQKRGHSRALSKEGPLGLPFDEALAATTFPGASAGK